MDPDSSIIYTLGGFFLLTLLGGFFAAAEASFTALNEGTIRRMAAEGDAKAKRIVKLVNRPAVFLTTVQAGQTLCQMLAIASLTHRLTLMAISSIWEGVAAPWVAYPLLLLAVTFVLGFILLILSNLLPKRLAAYYPEQTAFGLAGWIALCAVLLRPLVWLLTGVTNLLLRALGKNPNQQPETVTEEEIRMMVTVGEEKGAIEQSEREMIDNIFEFDDKVVTEIMTHRMEMTTLRDTATLEEAVNAARESGYSRIPVYHDQVDNIVGILYTKDLLGYISREESFVLSENLRTPLYVPETTRCIELFKEFQAKQLHMAIVVDEYGGTYGMVTMEDLLETIVGNIQDEFDREQPEYRQLSEDVYDIDGWMSVDEVESLLRVKIPDDSEYDTIAGVVVDMLGDLPPEGEHPAVQIGHILFTVLEVDDRRISKLRAQILPQEQPEE